MKKLKKLLILGLAVLMSFSLFACSSDDDDDDDDKDNKKTEQSNDKDSDKDSDKTNDKNNSTKVTAESILANIDMKDVESCTADIKFVMDLSIDMKESLLSQGYTEDDIQEAIDNGELDESALNMGMVMAMAMDGTMDYTKDYAYMSGSMDISMMGFNQQSIMETYYDYTGENEDISYTYNAEDDCWYYSVEDKASSSDINDIAEITKYLKEAEIVKDNDDEYVIELVIDFKKFYNDNPEKADELFSTSSDSLSMFDMESLIEEMNELPMTMGVDKETNYVSSLNIDLTDMFVKLMKAAGDSESQFSPDAIDMKEFSMELKFYNYNDVKVSIPDEVTENAVEESDFGWGDDWDDED